MSKVVDLVEYLRTKRHRSKARFTPIGEQIEPLCFAQSPIIKWLNSNLPSTENLWKAGGEHV